MKACLVMYNESIDKEVFTALRSSPNVKHYIKWEHVKGTGSGGLQILGAQSEVKYHIVMVALEDDLAECLFVEFQDLKKNLLNPAGLSVLLLNAEKIG